PALYSASHPPPGAPLHPYTTPYRSCGRSPTAGGPRRDRDRPRRRPAECHRRSSETCPTPPAAIADTTRPRDRRECDEGSSTPRSSEEHTSELQSRDNLVCRLLLGKN